MLYCKTVNSDRIHKVRLSEPIFYLEEISIAQSQAGSPPSCSQRFVISLDDCLAYISLFRGRIKSTLRIDVAGVLFRLEELSPVVVPPLHSHRQRQESI